MQNIDPVIEKKILDKAREYFSKLKDKCSDFKLLATPYDGTKYFLRFTACKICFNPHPDEVDTDTSKWQYLVFNRQGELLEEYCSEKVEKGSASDIFKNPQIYYSFVTLRKYDTI